MAHSQEKVKNCKDLDLPRQQVLLARHRCHEISSSITEEIARRTETERDLLDNGTTIEDFGGQLRRYRENALGIVQPFDHLELSLNMGTGSSL